MSTVSIFIHIFLSEAVFNHTLFDKILCFNPTFFTASKVKQPQLKNRKNAGNFKIFFPIDSIQNLSKLVLLISLHSIDHHNRFWATVIYYTVKCAINQKPKIANIFVLEILTLNLFINV